MSKQPALKPDEEQPRRPFRLRRLFAFGFAVILFVSLWPWGSYDPQDIARLGGGVPSSEIIHNCFGHLGARLSWGVLVVFGLAAYPLSALLLAASARRLFSGRGMRPAGWDYWTALVLLLFGSCMLLGIWPDFLAGFTERLNLAQMPGGALGQRLSSPGAGWLRFFLNPTGTAIIAVIAIGAASVILWVHDWHSLLVPYLFHRKDEDEESLGSRPLIRPEVAAAARKEPRERTQRDLLPEEPAPAPKAPAPPKPPEPAPVAKTDRKEKSRPAAGAPKEGAYTFPSLDLLELDDGVMTTADPKEVQRKTEILQETLGNFSIDAQVVKTTSGPRVTLFEVLPAPGVRVERISNISNNIAMELRAISLRILTPIPGATRWGSKCPTRAPRSSPCGV